MTNWRFGFSSFQMHALTLVIVALLAVAHALKPAKVFGTGLSKTGTTTLSEALAAMGYTIVHHDKALAPYMYPPNTVCLLAVGGVL